jgi:general secretion pathway protein K
MTPVRRRRRHGAGAMRGAALLLVLWLVALLTALVGTFALAARTEHLQGQVLSRGVVAQQAARAGIEYAITRVGNQDPRWRWLADGREYHWDYAGAQVAVRIVDEQGKVDLNMADAGLLASLLQGLGSDPRQAAQLAAAILDWRDIDSLTQPSGGAEDADYAAAGRAYGAADAPLESVAEVEQVLGMTPALYARLAPHVTVYSGRERPDPAFASAEVLAAMGWDAPRILAQRQAWTPASGRPPPLLPDGQPLVGADSGTYSIDSRARLRGRTAVLRVVVRTGGNGLPGSAWTALRWEEGASSR